jgi:hypothetical protein
MALVARLWPRFHKMLAGEYTVALHRSSERCSIKLV